MAFLGEGSKLLSYFGTLSEKEKRNLIFIAVGSALTTGTCLAAMVAWRNYQRDSFFHTPSSAWFGRSQKSQFVVNELRKMNEELVAVKKDINDVKVLIKQLRRDIAELRCLERNGAISFTAGNLLLPFNSNGFQSAEPHGYVEDDDSDFDFRSANSDENAIGKMGGASKTRLSRTSTRDKFYSPVTSQSDLTVATVQQITNSSRFSSDESFSRNVLDEIDNQLDSVESGPKRDALNRLEDLSSKRPDDPELMWRLGRALYIESESIRAVNTSDPLRKEMAYRAKDLCLASLEAMDKPIAAAYKWSALTLGALHEYESITNKIQQGYEFRRLIEKAIELEPNDALSHYLLGRWFFGVYQLTWYERKIAATLFATPPTATVDEALGEFLKCSEQLEASGQPEWKENCLYIAKCFIEKRDNSGNVQHWLRKGSSLPTVDEEGRVAGEEIAKLLVQYP